MDKPISELMTNNVSTVSTEDTIEKVDTILASQEHSTFPVVDEKGEIFGTISSQDLTVFHAAKKNPKTATAWEVCTYRPVAVAPETPTLEVARLMIDKKIDHVLVSDNGTLCGIVSALDFVEQYALGEDIKS